MVTRSEAKIHRVGPRHTIYLAKDLVEDSTFPFSADENLTVRIEGDALIIDKDGRSGYRSAKHDSAPSDIEKKLLKTLSVLNFSPLASKAERINQMLGEIHEAEVLESRIRQMPKNEHAIFLWDEESVFDMVLSEFFDDSVTGEAAKGLFSLKPRAFDSIDNMLSSEVSGLNKPAAIRKIREWMTRVHSSNRSDLPTRIAIEDYSWLSENGMARGLIELEHSIGPRVKENMTILCGYRFAKIDPKNLENLIGLHGYAILDHPLRVFRRMNR